MAFRIFCSMTGEAMCCVYVWCCHCVSLLVVCSHVFLGVLSSITYIYICVVAMRGVAIVRVSCCSQFVVMLATDRTQLAGRCA